jgi:hypothetical protein
MTHDISGLADTLLRNHIAIKFPRSNARSEFLQLPQDASDTERQRLEHAVAGESLIIRCHRSAIRLGLIDEHRQFFDHIDTNDDGDWVIHLFFADARAIPLVADITDGTVSPDDSETPFPKTFIERRLRHLERNKQLTDKCCWWDWDESW